jgi:aryl-alcohol dehydrogenase-like predicted oxidoreductase
MNTDSALPLRALGRTGLHVSALGLGAAQLGRHDVDEHEAERIVATALERGVNLFDSARSYGLSEERLGRALRGRREAAVIATKGGYGIDGVAEWTGPCITAGIDAALARLATDRIEVFFLHSCPVEVLARGDVVEALGRCVESGKVRAAGYSGENDALAWAVRSGRFHVIETSVNLCDQRGLDGAVREAAEKGLGVIAKRPLANAAWRFAERPVGDYAEVYWERLRAMELDPSPLAWDELALRFVAYAPGVTACITGTASAEHLARNVDLVTRGPLDTRESERVREAFRAHDTSWIGQV